MLSNFKSFLTESLDVEKLKHLEHVEDHIIHGGHEGVAHASETLSDVLAFLEGTPRKSFNKTTRITTKYDGAPSIVFGINPENGRFFVASKSAFNKNPKINYTDKDIEENHGHAPGLVKKLKAALAELPNIMPRDGGVFQGDLMYEREDVDESGGGYAFTPNLISYKAKKDSTEGRRIAASKLGIVVHTRYTGKTLADSKASFDVDQSSFKIDPNVNMINPELQPTDISNIEKKKFEKAIEAATKLYSGMDADVFNVVDGHDDSIKMYINQCVRDGTTPDVKGYKAFTDKRHAGEIEKMKSEAGKAKKKEAADVMASHITGHMKQLDNIFKLHNLLQQAKDTLVGALSRANTGFTTTIGGQNVKPEGFVAIRGGRPSKLVDRAEFSRANLTGAGKFNKKTDDAADKAEELVDDFIFSFGRMNPPTAGHGVLVGKVQELAKERKAKHRIVLSRSQDPEKNPLSPEDKVKHAKRMFGGANIEAADETAPTIIDQMKRIAKEGHKNVTVVVGSDRVESIKKLLDKQNGVDYKFNKIEVVSAGTRDPDADDEDPKSVSATRQRSHAIANKFGEFKKGVPKDFHPDFAKDLFQAVRQGMDIKIDRTTPGISLSRYAKRNDPIGVKARAEQARRLKEKESLKKVKK